MEHFIEFVQNWGYLAVFIGSLVEGESVILTATFLAYNGYLSLPKIMLVAFTGTLLAEQVCYFIGRYYGAALFDKYPKFKPQADKAFVLLKKWDIWFILSCRFIYGIRTISPFVIGASGISPDRFIPLNVIAALIWTLISCIGGYMLGSTVEKIIANFHVIQQYILFIFLIIVAVISLVVWYRNKKRAMISNDIDNK